MASPEGHVNIEVVSGNYRAADIAAKAAAGFRMHGNGSDARAVAHRQCRETGQLERVVTVGVRATQRQQQGKGVIEL